MPSMLDEPNAVTYNTCIFDQSGNLHVVSHVYERFVSKRLDKINEIMSYGQTYEVSPLLNVRFAHRIRPLVILTDKGRKIYANPAQQILTDEGFVTVDNLGMRSSLRVGDFSLSVDTQYGFRKYSRGKYRVQAFLRAHQIPFQDPNTKDYDGSTITDDFEIYCLDHNTEPALHNGILTLGINNYREYLMKHYDVGEFSYDKIKKISQIAKPKYALTVEVGGLNNYIVHTGAVFKSSPHGDRND